MKTWLIISSITLAIITTPTPKQTTITGNQPETHTASTHALKTESKENIPEPPKVAPEAPKIANNGSSRDFIFFKESGGRLNAINSIGCIGLGQSCAAKKGGIPPLQTACPNWQTDMACQLAFWDNYAIRRYGSWDNAVAFWQVKHWW